jgi:hypothetical protein
MIYALALRLHVLPEQIFEMTETDFSYLIATCKLEAQEQEDKWRKHK